MGPLERLTPRDNEALSELLTEARLPLLSLEAAEVLGWGVPGADGGATLAVACVEGRGPARLLRSVVVGPALRRQGMGSRLVRGVEEAAQAEGVEELYLLTETAAPFFAALGYEQIERSEAPEAIAKSEEFSSLCPASATFMRRRLNPA